VSARPECDHCSVAGTDRPLTVTLYLIGLGAGLAAAVLGAALPARIRIPAVVAGCLAMVSTTFVSATRVLLGAESLHLRTTAVLPITGVDLTLDRFGALFVAVTAIVGFAASWYLVGYARGALRSRTASAAFALFLVSLLAIPAAASVATFMFAWEAMALTSTLLVLTEHRHRAEARDAAIWYASMTHIGAAFILVGLLVLAGGGGQSFSAIAVTAAHLSPATRSVAFMLVLVGFASKAGAVPFHVWLPRAHPEAPSPVSALMSGAMVNLGIYGIVRVGDTMLSGGELWWWLLVAALGVLSALYGAVHAMASSDLKRLLAYSTIDNLGIVLVAVGVAGALEVTGHRELAALSMIAALFHVVTHAFFKTTLFLGAGAIEHATGTHDLDQLGGLARRMPLTTALFGVGAAAIAAVPGLSGFASEWLVFESLLRGFATHSGPTLAMLLLGIAALALTGGLTAAAFVKAFGIGFLGQPRTAAAADAREVSLSMLVAMAVVASACVALGLFPGVLSSTLLRVGDSALGARLTPVMRSGVGLSLARVDGAIEPVLVVVAVLVALAVSWIAVRLFAARAVRRAEAWGSGRAFQTARMEYTATSFAEPLGRVFDDLLRPDRDVEVTHAIESRYFPSAITYRSALADGFERVIYRPVVGAVEAWGRFARRAQNGSIHRYLTYGFAALVIALVVLA
jgi:hydrogenase-4 component B